MEEVGLGELLAARLGWPYEEGDALHPPANVAKMHAGHPLDDADRAPWLAKVAGWVDARLDAGECGVITCSALKRKYRELIAGGRDDVALVYLKGDYALIERRLAARAHAYMPASLLRSQFEALEEPGADEHPIVVSIEPPPGEIVEAIVAALR